MQKKVVSYCGKLISDNDVDHFLISMLAQSSIREDLWSLFAFNFEIAKTRYVVSDTTLGLIRLQWWRDCIAGIFERDIVPEHEVIKPLYAAIRRHDLPRDAFDSLIYAREFDLEDKLPSNIEGLINYADFTTRPLLELAVKICGDDSSDATIKSVAINYALAKIVRNVAVNARQGVFMLPKDLMEKYGIAKENIFDKSDRDNLCSLVSEIMDVKLLKSSPENIVLKAYETLSDIYFRQILALNNDTMSPKLQLDPAFKALRLFWKTKIL